MLAVLEYLTSQWDDLPAVAQDILLLAALTLPTPVVGIAVMFGLRPGRLAAAMLWRFRWTSLLFIALIAISVGIGVGIIAQERALRQGTARASERFDLIVSAPGSEITMLMAAVYLQPADVSLLSGAVFDRVARHEHVRLAAPIAFGDSAQGSPVIGTTAALVKYLTGQLAEGRLFERPGEVVIGIAAPQMLGERFSPDHGIGDAVEPGSHEGYQYVVVGRMQRTGSPWDRAILVPIESIWEVHGLAMGHAPGEGERIGPPFDPSYFPGTPAILVLADELWASYALKSEFTTAETMAFFPGTVLAQLHSLLGDVRQVMSVLAVVTQILVVAGVLTGLVILGRLFARQLALLRALGAPRRFVFAVVWSFAAALVISGALLGLAMGYVAAGVISRIITARTDILVTAGLGWPELHLVAAFVSLAVMMALLPAGLALARPVVNDLRR